MPINAELASATNVRELALPQTNWSFSMQVPTEISFQNCEASEEARSEIVRQVQRLQKFSKRLTSCHVVVVGPESRHRRGDPFRIDITITMPQHNDIVVNRSKGSKPEHQHVLVAIRDAFSAAQRQIEDLVREMRGEVKVHSTEDHGRVVRFLAGKDCGFIEAANGRELFFHRNSVLDGAFDELVVGTQVRFVEEEGEKGPQASTVRSHR